MVTYLLTVATLLTSAPALAKPVTSSPLSDAFELLETVQDLYGNPYPVVIRSLGVTFDVVPLPQIFYGGYQQRARRIVLSSRLLDEDATVMATVIAHELQHAQDRDYIAFGLLEADCTELEVRAFEAQSRTWRALWTGDLSTGTRIERDLTHVTQIYEAEGIEGLRVMVAAMPFYRRACEERASGSSAP